MSRLIDANEVLKSCVDEKGNYLGHDAAVVGEAVSAAPTVDAVAVCRCKDCRAYGEMLPGKDNRMICHKWALNFEPNHYCSYGARKDGGVNDEQRVH